jgi:hypothetical protein
VKGTTATARTTTTTTTTNKQKVGRTRFTSRRRKQQQSQQQRQKEKDYVQKSTGIENNDFGQEVILSPRKTPLSEPEHHPTTLTTSISTATNQLLPSSSLSPTDASQEDKENRHQQREDQVAETLDRSSPFNVHIHRRRLVSPASSDHDDSRQQRRIIIDEYGTIVNNSDGATEAVDLQREEVGKERKVTVKQQQELPIERHITIPTSPASANINATLAVQEVVEQQDDSTNGGSAVNINERKEEKQTSGTFVQITKGRHTGKQGYVIGWTDIRTIQVMLCNGTAADDDDGVVVVNVRLTSVVLVNNGNIQPQPTDIVIPIIEKSETMIAKRNNRRQQQPPTSKSMFSALTGMEPKEYVQQRQRQHPLEEGRRVTIIAGKHKSKSGIFLQIKNKNTCLVELDDRSRGGSSVVVAVRRTSIEEERQKNQDDDSGKKKKSVISKAAITSADSTVTNTNGKIMDRANHNRAEAYNLSSSSNHNNNDINTNIRDPYLAGRNVTIIKGQFKGMIGVVVDKNLKGCYDMQLQNGSGIVSVRKSSIQQAS